MFIYITIYLLKCLLHYLQYKCSQVSIAGAKSAELAIENILPHPSLGLKHLRKGKNKKIKKQKNKESHRVLLNTEAKEM